jgi:hypothetical protein
VAEDGRPVANVGVGVEIDGIENVLGAITDAAGHYQLTLSVNGSPHQPVTLWGQAFKAGYVQQCAAKTTVVGDSTMLDIRLTSIANLSMARPMSDPGSRSMSGTVFQATPTGPRPVQGATVGWYAFFDEGQGMAQTVTDAAGFYLLCGLPQTRLVSGDIYSGGFYAVKEGEGYASQIPIVEAGMSDVVLNLELKK